MRHSLFFCLVPDALKLVMGVESSSDSQRQCTKSSMASLCLNLDKEEVCKIGTLPFCSVKVLYLITLYLK